ncbi:MULTISPECIES: glycosyltransferase [unclassified Isoptericola]|uniref:glycosyltransferase n=1 Tax=unclassified Isoptericola TaxID=2623355 RepID=UPI002713273E|nr:MULTISPECIES: glycosyltransferase [unclassified Isoptericola]MDO8143324.1 glycosyltransferase [Isoptericola sp. 178]MDO8150500.1 glycosyltransferase [Isoptericola sp. b408]
MASTEPSASSPDDTPTAVRLLVVGVLFALAVSPAVLLFGLRGAGAAGTALVALALVFVGPAFSAAAFALGDRAIEEGLGPVAAFGRGYRINAMDALVLWVPSVLALAGLTLAVASGIGTAPAWATGVGIGAAVLLLLWLVQATVIASFFSFRARDTAKLALYFLGRLPRSTLVVLVAVVLAGAVGWLMSPALLALLGILWVAAVLRADRPLLAETRQRFVADDS